MLDSPGDDANDCRSADNCRWVKFENGQYIITHITIPTYHGIANQSHYCMPS